jgi:hypothetical protein
MLNPNFRAICLNKVAEIIENDAMDIKFCIYDENGDLVTDLSGKKFAFTLDNGGLELEKKDSNYTDGSDTQISVSGEIVTVHISSNETDTWGEGWWSMILQMTEISTGKQYTVYRKKTGITSELLDF